MSTFDERMMASYDAKHEARDYTITSAGTIQDGVVTYTTFTREDNAMPMKLTSARKSKADELVEGYQRLNEQLRISRETMAASSDPVVEAYERMIQARIERQLILMDTVRV